MASLMDTGVAMISAAQRRLEVVGQNLANVATPGYQRSIAFVDLLADPVRSSPVISRYRDDSAGRTTTTNVSTDLAIDGPGLFPVREGSKLAYVRGGQFTRQADGTLANAIGQVLQMSDGGDLTLKAGAFTVKRSGEVVQHGAAIGRIALFVGDNNGDMRE